LLNLARNSLEHIVSVKNAMSMMGVHPETFRIVSLFSTRGCYQPTTAPITLGIGAYQLQYQILKDFSQIQYALDCYNIIILYVL
jgi:hypothetical protein